MHSMVSMLQRRFCHGWAGDERQDGQGGQAPVVHSLSAMPELRRFALQARTAAGAFAGLLH